MFIISFANQKGGVGKTTAVINIAAEFALRGRYEHPENPPRILVVDMDPQCNTVSVLNGGVYSKNRVAQLNVTLGEILIGKVGNSIRDIVVTSPVPQRKPGNLDFLYSTPPSMKTARDILTGHIRQESYKRLADALYEVIDDYSYIFIDTGPAEDKLTYNALVASTHVVIPIEPAAFSLQGVTENFEYIEDIRNLNPDLKVAGILPSRFHSQYSGQKDTMSFLDRKYQELVLPVITERAETFDAIQAGYDIFSFKPARSSTQLQSSAQATREFAKVASEIRRRINKETGVRHEQTEN